MRIQNDLFFVREIIRLIRRIESAIRKMSEKEFFEHDIITDGILRNLELIGEVSTKTSNDLRSAYPHVQWREMIDMRNILIHNYFGVDLNIVWETIHADLPELKAQMEAIAKQLK
jgi:uncharacterized protein with HEPN domain